MKRMLLVILALLLVGFATQAEAQTLTKGPVPAGYKFKWDAPTNITTVAQALTFEPRIRLDGTPATALTNVTCAPPVAPATVISCESVITQSNRDALNVIGSHSMTLSLFRADVGDSDVSDPFVLPTGAGKATNVRIGS